METELLYIFLLSMSCIMAKEDDLPLCPTNVQFFPQNLPMHCRMPRSVDFPPFPPMPPGAPPIPNFPPQFYQSPLQDKQQSPVPIPFPPSGPPMPFPGPIPAPGPMPMPMMAMQGPAHKLPVIVMPFYKPDPSFRNQLKKLRHPKKDPQLSIDADTDSTDSDTESDTNIDADIDAEGDTSSDTSSDKDSSRERGWWKRRGIGKNDYRRSRKHKKIGRRFNSRHKSRPKKRSFRRKELLTPVLQYVTKDGYVIFEKQISKDEAKDWLRVRKDDDDNTPSNKNDNLDFDERELEGQKVSQSKVRPEDKLKSNEEEDNRDKSKEQANIEEEPTTSRVHVIKHRRHKPNILIADKPHKHKF